MRTLDAIHLVAAFQVGSRIEAAVIYDPRLAEAARNSNVVVQAPRWRIAPTDLEAIGGVL